LVVKAFMSSGRIPRMSQLIRISFIVTSLPLIVWYRPSHLVLHLPDLPPNIDHLSGKMIPSFSGDILPCQQKNSTIRRE
jgi:hypothetical protein